MQCNIITMSNPLSAKTVSPCSKRLSRPECIVLNLSVALPPPPPPPPQHCEINEMQSSGVIAIKNFTVLCSLSKSVLLLEMQVDVQ